MVSRLEYPRLSRSEIVAFLKEYQIIPSVTEYQLAHPDSDIVSHPRVNQLAFYNHLSSSLLRAITMGSNRVYGVFIYRDQQNHRAMSSMKKGM
ncbi:hypothetical protein SAY87_000158 [Trapa incisa]|uniref:Uncharacterized protein n=1 Tax=Trapa incisa TaxID=236973 RepID=A0AAN7GMU0_9MYRT|nr:hypothetical protein SAY87_000158 [Trapa incisa]